MPALKIDHFGGELPSTSARALPPNAAQTHHNLHLGLSEFRPLPSPSSAGNAAANSQTLYRFNGNFLSHADYRSYVKGQINEEKTERTYLTHNNGSARPRLINNQGLDRELGVWQPVKPSIQLQQVDEFTPEEANNFFNGPLAESVRQALQSSLSSADSNTQAARWSGSLPIQGAKNLHSLSAPTTAMNTNWANAIALVPQARANLMDLPALGALAKTGNNHPIPIKMAPAIKTINRSTLVSKLTALTYPSSSGERSGKAVFTSAQAGQIADQAINALAQDSKLSAMRDELTEIAREFASLMLSQTWTSNPPAKPTPPTKPTVPEWDYDEHYA